MKNEPAEPADGPPGCGERPPKFSVGDQLGLVARGLAMGGADVVPGVSGGTIAFITGVYERFIAALKSVSAAPLVELLRGRPREAWRAVLGVHWAVLLPLGLGIVTAIVTMSRVIKGYMETHPGETYAFFFGLIAASAWVPMSKMRERAWRHLAAGAAAAFAALLITGVTPTGLALHAPDVPPATSADAGDAPIRVVYPGKIRSAGDLDAVARAAVDALGPGVAGGARFVVLDEDGVLPAGLATLAVSTADDGAADATAGLVGAPLVVLGSEDELADILTADDGAQVVILEEDRAPLLWVFLCGVIAISAMILPGLSGSFLLLFLGQYHAVFSALHRTIDAGAALLTGGGAAAVTPGASPAADAAYVGVFLVGVVTGLATFSRVVAWLFRRFHDATMAALTGLMLGALRLPATIVWESRPAAPDADASPAGYWVAIAIAAAVGLAIVLGLAGVEAMRARRQAS